MISMSAHKGYRTGLGSLLVIMIITMMTLSRRRNLLIMILMMMVVLLARLLLCCLLPQLWRLCVCFPLGSAVTMAVKTD